MTRLTRHLRSNAVAYLALFVALGGTSYAAINLPAGSVGTKQLKNGSVTADKIDPKSIGGSVKHWASVSASGRLFGGSRGARVIVRPGDLYVVDWGDRFSRGCATSATSPGVFGHAPIADSIGIRIVSPASSNGSTALWISPYANGAAVSAPFEVAVVC